VEFILSEFFSGTTRSAGVEKNLAACGRWSVLAASAGRGKWLGNAYLHHLIGTNSRKTMIA
jgi:hypothetical protein